MVADFVYLLYLLSFFPIEEKKPLIPPFSFGWMNLELRALLGDMRSSGFQRKMLNIRSAKASLSSTGKSGLSCNEIWNELKVKVKVRVLSLDPKLALTTLQF